MKKNILISLSVSFGGAIAGIFIGFWMTIFSNALNGNFDTILPSGPTWTSHFPNVLTAFIVSAILWMIMGVMFALSGYWIFARNPWNLGITAATFTHFAITVIGSLVIAFAAGWYTTVNVENAVSFVLLFTIVYIIIWSISMVNSRKKVNELNAQLEK